LARYLAAFLASVGIFALSYYVVVLVTGFALYGQVVPNVLEVLGMALLYTASMVALVMLFSSLVKNPAVSVLLSVIIVLLGMGVIAGIAEVTNVEPWFLLTYAGQAVSGLAQQTYPAHHTTYVTPGLSVGLYNPYVLEAAQIMIGYLAVSLGLAYLIYSRRQLKET
jgi:ABC-type transport system involved in multi-copper enzyme maturation permease subunit